MNGQNPVDFVFDKIMRDPHAYARAAVYTFGWDGEDDPALPNMWEYENMLDWDMHRLATAYVTARNLQHSANLMGVAGFKSIAQQTPAVVPDRVREARRVSVRAMHEYMSRLAVSRWKRIRDKIEAARTPGQIQL